MNASPDDCNSKTREQIFFANNRRPSPGLTSKLQFPTRFTNRPTQPFDYEDVPAQVPDEGAVCWHVWDKLVV